MNTFRSLLFLLLFWTPTVLSAQVKPIDPGATPETQILLQNLYQSSRSGIMFGHQDDLAYGIGWKYKPGGSDIKYTVDEYPAVFGWDLGHLELDSPLNIDSVPFAQIRKFIQHTYKMGLVNTISWHLHNPVTGESSWSKVSSFEAILPGGEKHALYLSWLDRLADFLKSLKKGSKEIPVILRLFHEHNGSWFWWGKAHCSPEEYKSLWKLTVDYLQSRDVHNVLYAYSPDKFYSEEEYLERYPGDQYIDILGLDDYPAKTTEQFIRESRQMVETLVKIAEQKQKIAALTETGLNVSNADWWTQVLLPIIRDTKLAYALVWRNARTDHFFAPYPGQASAEDFKKFYQSDSIFFEKKTSKLKLYKVK